MLKSKLIKEVKFDRFQRELNGFLFTIDDDSIVSIDFQITTFSDALLYTVLIIYKEDTK